MKNKLKILCILMLLCLCGCGNNDNKEINDNVNTPLYNSNNVVEDKQDEKVENNELIQDTSNKDEIKKEEQIQENQTTTSQNSSSNNLNKNNATNNNATNNNNSNDVINDNNKESTNDSIIENEEKNEDLPQKNETEDDLNNDIYNDKLVYLDIYYRDSCSYCHKLFAFLDSLDENLKSKLIITKYNVEEHNSKFDEAVNKFSGNVAAGTPYTVFNNQKAIMGYSEAMEQKYLNYISEFIN